MVVEIVHFYGYFGNGDSVNYFNRYDFTFEWLARIFWALSVFNTIEILIKRFCIRLTLYITEEKCAAIINLV